MTSMEIKCCGPCERVLGTAQVAEEITQKELQRRAGKPVCALCYETWRPNGKRLPYFDPLNPPT